MSKKDSYTFEEDVFPDEQQVIRDRRAVVGKDSSAIIGSPDPDQGLVGLGLSGGGIRSATFALGVIQGLSKHGILKHVDYLSTVSGGGYIGSTLSCLLNDSRHKPEGKEFPLRYTAEKSEPPALTHLRNSSNYLSPVGLLPKLRLPNLMLRGILLNLFVFLPYIMFVVFLTEAAYELGPHWDNLPRLLIPLIMVFVALTLAFPFLIRLMRSLFNWERRNAYELLLTIPLLVAGVVLIAIPLLHVTRIAIEHSTHDFHYWFQQLSPAELWQFAAVTLGIIGLFMFAGKASQNVAKLTGKILLWLVGLLGPALIFVIFLVLCLWQIDSPFLPADSDRGLNAATKEFPPCPVDECKVRSGEARLFDTDSSFWETLFKQEEGPSNPEELKVALHNRGLIYSDNAVVSCQSGGCDSTPDALDWENDTRIWVITDLGSAPLPAYKDFECPPYGQEDARNTVNAREFCTYFSRISKNSLRISGPQLHLFEGSEDYLFVAIFLSLLCVNWFFLNINITSPHGFYRDRLSKAYLFSVSPKGETQPEDDLLLSSLNAEGTTAPYHLINVALNLQGSDDPDLRGRKSDLFTFTRNYCGNHKTGWTPTREMEKVDGHLDLATAVAISGAAAAPNMGKTTNRSLVFIMTLLNIRLGYWLPNPEYVNKRSRFGALLLGNAQPSLIWKEALGQLDSKGPHINVSDGGHIENLAIYQLLKRQCKFIVAVDGECDKTMSFKGLTTLMRFARIDMGIEIDFGNGLDVLRKSNDGLSKNHWALAEIRYADGGTGQLLYIKLSVTGDEPEYVRSYSAKNPAFPHESTADQWFSEEQFEAYRALGEHACEGMLKDVEHIGGFATLRDKPRSMENPV